MKHQAFFLAGLALLLALVVGCGGAAAPTAAPPTAAPAATSAPAATGAPAATSAPAATEAATAAAQPTTDPLTAKAQADAKAYLAKVCDKPIGGELNMLVWEGYSDPSFADFFSQQCGVKINATFQASSGDLVAKLKAGGTETFDLVSPSSDAITFVVANDLVQQLDLSKLPTYDKLSPEIRNINPPLAKKGDKTYGMPFTFGPNPLVYNTKEFPTPPQSWNDLWDPKLKGKISMQDDIATVWMAAQALGMDDPKDPTKLYNLSDDDLNKVKDYLIKLKPNIRKLWTSGDLIDLFKSEGVVAAEGWPFHTNQLIAAGYPAGETVPKEGTTGWIDHWMLTKGAQNLPAAYAWMEYVSQPFTQRLVYDYTGYTVSNPATAQYLTPEEISSIHMDNLKGYGEKINYWKWGTKREKYEEIWNEVKAAP